MNKIQEFFIRRRLKPILKEFENQVKKYFNNSYSKVDYVLDKENKIIWGKIHTSMDVDDALDTMNKMDNEWFFKLGYKYRKYFSYDFKWQ